jgi:amidase
LNLAEYSNYDATGLVELVRRGDVAPRELAQTGLAAIAALNPALNAVIETYPEASSAAAPGGAPFPGVPFLLKDIGSHDANVTFEMGTRLAKGLKAPPFASELVNRFRAAGVTILGRTNVPDFGASCSTEPLLHGPTRNPWNLERSPGGSSGGAAAAVASGMVPIAHANDAGGSIRCPSSFCGVFGLKPSRNLNPVGPDTALALHGLATEHIVSRSVRDTATMLDATAGPDIGAWCWTPRLQGSYRQALEQPPGRLRVALSLNASFPPTAIEPEVADTIRDTARLCESLGHYVEEADLEYNHETLFHAFTLIWSCGMRSGMEALCEFTGRTASADTLEPHLLAAWRDAEKVPAAKILWALDQMNIAARAYGRLFQRYDVLLTPVAAMEPFSLGRIPALPTGTFDEWCRAMCAHCPFLSTVNLAGVPAMSVPLGWSRAGLPIGSHFVAAAGAETLLLQLAAQLEQARPWAHRRPPHHVAAQR